VVHAAIQLCKPDEDEACLPTAAVLRAADGPVVRMMEPREVLAEDRLLKLPKNLSGDPSFNGTSPMRSIAT